MAGKVLIIGATGLLGADLSRYFGAKYDRIGIGSADLDIRHKSATAAFIKQLRPEIVINAAAWTNVDACQKDRQKAFDINAEGAGNIAAACKEARARLVHFSTDYVFDGEKKEPYSEGDQTGPVNIYGQSKLDGEKQVLSRLPEAAVVRVAWLYNNSGKSFVPRLIERGRRSSVETEPIMMITDQIGAPTWTDEVVRQTDVIIDKKITGIIHCTSGGACSRFDLAQLLFASLGREVPLAACSRRDFPDRAPRPAYTALANSVLDRAGANNMKNYKTALQEFLETAGYIESGKN